MPWFKVDDQLAFHQKTVIAGNEAIGLWVRAGAWSAAQLTDGFIPKGVAEAMANQEVCHRLLSANLWTEVENGYQFHDWSEFQPSAKKERERRDEIKRSRSEAGKRGAEARWGNKSDSKPVANAMAIAIPNAMANEWQNDGPDPDPIKPPVVPHGGRPKRHRLTDDFTPSEAHQKKAKELGANISVELERFKNHFIGNGDTKADWNRTFSNWLSRSVEFNTNGRPQAPQSSFDPWASEWSEDDFRKQT